MYAAAMRQRLFQQCILSYYTAFSVVVMVHIIIDNVGDHAMPEHLVFRSPDAFSWHELCWAYVVLPRCT